MLEVWAYSLVKFPFGTRDDGVFLAHNAPQNLVGHNFGLKFGSGYLTAQVPKLALGFIKV